jgi:hypothetical protein
MIKYHAISILLILFTSFCISCESDNVEKTDCVAIGTLVYSKPYWEIIAPEPNTIDVVDYYLIKNYHIKLHKDSAAFVRATGKRFLYDDKSEEFIFGATRYILEVESLEFIKFY